MNSYRAAIECCKVFIHLEQQPCESTHEYYERFQWYMDEYPYHGLQSNVLLDYFLDGMLPDERYILDDMAGGWIMDCTPEYVWHLIETRAEGTRPYDNCSRLLMDMFNELQKKMEEIHEELEECSEKFEECNNNLERCVKNMQDLKGAPELTQVSLDDKEVTLLIEEQAVEEIMDGELQVVPITSVEDVPTEEWSSPQGSDIIIAQDTVIPCTHILPKPNLFLSSHVQNDTIQTPLRNIQVWGSLHNCKIHIPEVRIPMKMQKLEQLLEGSCINWKFRKKREEKMRGSLRKVAFRTQRDCAKKRLKKLPNGMRITWKRRNKGKCILLNNEISLFLIHIQKSRSTFGWKPGWDSSRSLSHKVIRKERKAVRKFDGVHPWAPNI